MGQNIVKEKSRNFAIRIRKLYVYLRDVKKEFVMSKQVYKSGTSIGANIVEADHSMSKKEFISKLNIALKEAAETEYWLDILNSTECIEPKDYQSINNDCIEIKKLLVSIIKSSNNNI